jgi:cell division protein FtsW (lipid II flippase)
LKPLGVGGLVVATGLVCAGPWVRPSIRAAVAAAGVSVGSLSLVLALLFSGQATGFSLVVAVMGLRSARRLRRHHPEWLVGSSPPLLLLLLGAFVAERLGREWTLIGTDPANAVAIVIALLLISRPAGRLNVAGHRAASLILIGALVLFVGLAGGISGATSRTSVVLPVIGELVLAEVARAFLVVGIAFDIADRLPEWRFLRWGAPILPIVWFVALATVLGAGIAYKTGDIGGALLLVLCVAGVAAAITNRSWPISLGVAALPLIAPLVLLTSSLARARITAWLRPGAQQVAALSALAEGGPVGTGFGRGNPFRVPVVTSDYVIAAIGHELGAVGVLCVVALLVATILNLVRRSTMSISDRGYALCVASALLIGTQAVINLMGITGMAPVTGVPLPYVSRGGVFLVVCAILTRLSLRVSTKSPRSSPLGASHKVKGGAR